LFDRTGLDTVAPFAGRNGSMSVRPAALFAAALTVAGALLFTPAATPRASATSPNVVLVLTDDQRWDMLWAMPQVQSELVGHGVTFRNAFVVNPLCCPSRAAILTGRYSHSTGVYSNSRGYEEFLDDEPNSVAVWLDAVGYRTALVGKYANGYDDVHADHVPPGWDRWVAFTSQTGQGGYYDWSVSVDGEVVEYGNDPQDYSTDVLGQYAVDFIDSTPEDEPLFLVYTPKAPHLPSTPAPRHLDEFKDLPPWRPPSHNEPDVSDKPSWVQALPQLSSDEQVELDFYREEMYRSMLSVDDAVGNVVDALEASGRLSNTMIVFASDNGFLWGEHRWSGKKVVYDESIRIPMVIRYDPLTPQQRSDGHLVLNIDLAPTFAELAGSPAPDADGMSLLDVLAGRRAAWRTAFLIENSLESGGADEVPTYCAVRTKEYVYARFLQTNEEELYPLRTDPYQLVNRASDPRYGSVKAALRERVDALCIPPPP
jgi:N-acetylglucosamine-6-sulfatase